MENLLVENLLVILGIVIYNSVPIFRYYKIRYNLGNIAKGWFLVSLLSQIILSLWIIVDILGLLSHRWSISSMFIVSNIFLAITLSSWMIYWLVRNVPASGTAILLLIPPLVLSVLEMLLHFYLKQISKEYLIIVLVFVISITLSLIYIFTIDKYIKSSSFTDSIIYLIIISLFLPLIKDYFPTSLNYINAISITYVIDLISIKSKEYFTKK